MTLIIGIQCSDGAVICADSQETVGHYRASVQKIKPEEMGEYVVIVGGSGNGDLVDGFIQCLRERLDKCDSKDLDVFKASFENELARYWKEDVATVPKTQRRMSFVVGAYGNGRHKLWSTKGKKLIPVERFCMVGWDEHLYRLIVERLLSPGMTVAQGVLAGVYTLGIAEATSNYIRGPMQAGGVNNHGGWLDGNGYVADTNTRLHAFEQRLNSVLLASADIGMNLARYAEVLSEFTTEAKRLHKELLLSAVRRFLDGPTADWRTVNIAYNRIPPALSIAIQAGDFDDILGSGEKADLLAKMISAAKASFENSGA